MKSPGMQNMQTKNMAEHISACGLLISVFLLLILTCSSSFAKTPSYILYVGTYTGAESKGIYAYRYDAESGRMTSLGLMAETANPSFLTVDRSGKFLYAVNEMHDYEG